MSAATMEGVYSVGMNCAFSMMFVVLVIDVLFVALELKDPIRSSFFSSRAVRNGSSADSIPAR